MFTKVTRKKICMRECAKIVNIAEKYGCTITIQTDANSGSSDSIMSLMSLELTEGKIVGISIQFKEINQKTAIDLANATKEVSDVIDGKDEI